MSDQLDEMLREIGTDGGRFRFAFVQRALAAGVAPEHVPGFVREIAQLPESVQGHLCDDAFDTEAGLEQIEAALAEVRQRPAET